MDGDRNDAQPGAGEHHHRLGAAGQFGKILGMPGMLEAGGIEDLLVDRIGDDRRGAAGTGKGDGGVDCRDDGARVPGIAIAGAHRAGQGNRQHRQVVGEGGAGLLRRGDRRDRHAPAEPARQGGEAFGRIEQEEGRHALRPPPPRREGDLAADPGRLAHGQGERDHTRMSTKAERRRSRR